MLAKSPTIQEVAAASYKKAKGDILKATDIMEKTIMSDVELYRLLMDPLVRGACYDQVRLQARQTRGRVWESPQPTAAESRAAVESAASGILKGLFAFPLHNGIMLGNAYKQDVVNSAGFYDAQAQDMGIKARWLAMIAEKQPEEKQVKDCFTLAKLAALRKAAGWTEKSDEK